MRRSRALRACGPRPPYQARSDPAVGGPTKIDWRLSFDDFATSQPEEIVARHVRQPSWRRDQRGGISITVSSGSA